MMWQQTQQNKTRQTLGQNFCEAKILQLEKKNRS